jgi:lipopolysaccharide transport system permease protein
MFYAVKLYRQALFTSAPPEWRALRNLAISSILVVLAGGLFFRHMKKGFADVL